MDIEIAMQFVSVSSHDGRVPHTRLRFDSNSQLTINRLRWKISFRHYEQTENIRRSSFVAPVCIVVPYKFGFSKRSLSLPWHFFLQCLSASKVRTTLCAIRYDSSFPLPGGEHCSSRFDCAVLLLACTQTAAIHEHKVDAVLSKRCSCVLVEKKKPHDKQTKCYYYQRF